MLVSAPLLPGVSRLAFQPAVPPSKSSGDRLRICLLKRRIRKPQKSVLDRRQPLARSKQPTRRSPPRRAAKQPGKLLERQARPRAERFCDSASNRLLDSNREICKQYPGAKARTRRVSRSCWRKGTSSRQTLSPGLKPPRMRMSGKFVPTKCPKMMSPANTSTKTRDARRLSSGTFSRRLMPTIWRRFMKPCAATPGSDPTS
jgi:hypothetical protein